MRDGAPAPSHDGLTTSFPLERALRVSFPRSRRSFMRVQLAGVGKHHGAQVILEQVTLTVGPKARIGLVGPNGVGKTTLLRLMVGLEHPDSGTVTRAPDRLTVGYLEQERPPEPGLSVLESLARRTGIEQAERELEDAARALGEGLSA